MEIAIRTLAKSLVVAVIGALGSALAPVVMVLVGGLILIAIISLLTLRQVVFASSAEPAERLYFLIWAIRGARRRRS